MAKKTHSNTAVVEGETPEVLAAETRSVMSKYLRLFEESINRAEAVILEKKFADDLKSAKSTTDIQDTCIGIAVSQNDEPVHPQQLVHAIFTWVCALKQLKTNISGFIITLCTQLNNYIGACNRYVTEFSYIFINLTLPCSKCAPSLKFCSKYYYIYSSQNFGVSYAPHLKLCVDPGLFGGPNEVDLFAISSLVGVDAELKVNDCTAVELVNQAGDVGGSLGYVYDAAVGEWVDAKSQASLDDTVDIPYIKDFYGIDADIVYDVGAYALVDAVAQVYNYLHTTATIRHPIYHIYKLYANQCDASMPVELGFTTVGGSDTNLFYLFKCARRLNSYMFKNIKLLNSGLVFGAGAVVRLRLNVLLLDYA